MLIPGRAPLSTWPAERLLPRDSKQVTHNWETDQNRGRSTVRAPGDLSAPPAADLRVGGGVALVGVPEHCLRVHVTEPAPEGLQRDSGVDQFAGMRMTELMNRGSDLGFRPVLGPELSKEPAREETVATAGTVAGEAPGTVYRLRVVLSGISPMIWRQLEVPRHPHPGRTPRGAADLVRLER